MLSYTPYHMMAESRPLYLLLCIIGAPLRLRRRYHADPLLTGAAIVVYICVPIAIYTVASSFADQDQPTHHTLWWWRVDIHSSYTFSFSHHGSCSTAMTVPRQSADIKFLNRCIYMYAKRTALKWGNGTNKESENCKSERTLYFLSFGTFDIWTSLHTTYFHLQKISYNNAQ